MELTDSPFLILVRAGLWNIRPTEGEAEVFREADWQFLLAQANAHAVIALVADGMQLLPEEFLPSETLRARISSYVSFTEKANLKVNKVLDVMSAFWKKSGVTAVVLKGQGIAKMYPMPLHRTPGDIDWYFPGKAGFGKANALARSRGASLELDGDSDYHYLVGGVVVEHHSRWCDLFAPSRQKKAVALEAEYGYDSAGDFTVLSPTIQLLQLNAHILKHALIKGMGWRQLCDLARAYSCLQGAYDREQFSVAAKSLGLYRWARLLAGVLVKYLGLAREDLSVEPCSGRDIDRLASIVERSGNFGRSSGKGMFLSWLSTAGLFLRYAPGEFIWRPLSLTLNRTEQLLKKNK